MVGSPKQLGDLGRISARLSARCRTCGVERVFDPGPLQSELVKRGKSLVWSELPRSLPCACGSIDLCLRPVPFAAEAGAPAARAPRSSTQRMVTLALRVLDEAAYLSRTQTIDTPQVRLALAVLWVVLRDRKGIDAYWHRACNLSGHPWDTCRHPYFAIAAAARQEGWDAPVDGAT